MFAATLVWRGIVFTILMLIGKLVTGLWLIRIAAPSDTMATKIKAFRHRLSISLSSNLGLARSADGSKSQARNTADDPGSKAMPDVCIALTTYGERGPRRSSDRPLQSVSAQPRSSPTPQLAASGTRSRSLYPASIVGTAMMARGEIGFLIAALAESTGVFASHHVSAAQEENGLEIYLVVVWAVVLCTVIGPLSVGLLVRRVKKLQRQRREHGGGEDPLGVWGVL